MYVCARASVYMCVCVSGSHFQRVALYIAVFGFSRLHDFRLNLSKQINVFLFN